MNNDSNKRKSTQIEKIIPEREEALETTSQPEQGKMNDEKLGTGKNSVAQSEGSLFQTAGLNSQLEELRAKGLLDGDDLEEQITKETSSAETTESAEESETTKETLSDDKEKISEETESSLLADEDSAEKENVGEAIELKSILEDSDDKDSTDSKKNKPKKESKLKEYAFLGKNSENKADIFGSEYEASKKKRKKTIIATLVGIFAIIAAVYAGGVYYFQDKFLPNTYVNGKSISAMTLSEADESISTLSKNRTVKLLGSDGLEAEIKATDVGFNLTEMPDLSETLESQDPFSWPVHLLPNESTNIDNASTIDENALTNTVANLEIVTGPQVVKTENARAEYNKEDGVFVAREEVYGTEVDVPKLIGRVRESLVDGNPVINLEEEDDYVRPVTHEDSEILAQSIDKLNSVQDTVITYDFKASQEKLDKNTFIPWLMTTDTGEPAVNQEMASQYVASLAQKYDTLDRPVNFSTSTGTPIQVHDWVMGWQINQPQEVAELSQAILDGKSVTREPVYSSTGRDRMSNNSIINTYLEISLSDQHMWFYKNGQLVVDTPVVTGDPSKGHSTPEGLFNLQDKEMYVTLSGPGYDSPVTYWLPFDGGVGVHDASWRSSYGGSIFYGNGSHGCVNTPYYAVQTIYENIDVETPVVVY